MRQVRLQYPRLKVHVLIRPREGDFVYTPGEVRQMEYDISEALPYTDGIVVGALTSEGDIDLPVMEVLVKAAKGRPVTFHRAFDVCRDPVVALEQIISLGCRRLLSSGQAATAEQGISVLRRLSDLAGDRLIVMPGGGVNPVNAGRILTQTATTEIHGSCSGTDGITSTGKVSQVLAALRAIG